MRILLADSDRDLLQSYATLLAMDGHEVTQAFDGAQVVSLLAHGPYDTALLEETLPRVEHGRLMRLMAREALPVIVILNGRVTAKHLLRPDLPCGYLSLPFLPGDLTGLIESVREKRASGEPFPCGDAVVDVAGFAFQGTDIRLTAAEIDLLTALKRGKMSHGRHARTVILALNEKLARMNRRTHIRYELEKGYTLVSDHE